MDERNSYAATTAVVFGLGAVAGAALGMLFAPAPGRQTRDQVGRRLRETASSARDLKGRLLEKSERAIRNGERVLGEVSRTARQAVTTLSGKSDSRASNPATGPAAGELS